MRGIIYGVIGGVASIVLYFFLGNVGSEVTTGTITISTIICACTGILVDKLNNKQ